MPFFPCRFEMTVARRLAAGAVLLAGAPISAQAVKDARRTTFAVTYADGDTTRVDMVGSAAQPGVLGSASVKRRAGRTRVQLRMGALPHPQSLGSFYTTYVLWAVAPEGQAASLAELPHSKRIGVDVTASFQTFGLIVSAEPHSAVSLPSPLIVAENTPRSDTVGRFHSGTIEYGGAIGALYASADDPGRRDFVTPLLVLGTRHAIDLAKEAGAEQHAPRDLQQAERKLDTLEQAWPRRRRLPKDLEGIAHEAMRTAEHARHVALERREQIRLAAERRDANTRVAQAQNEADRARGDAKEAHESAVREQVRAAEAKREAERAKADEQRAKATEEAARARAEKERLEAGAARLDADRARQEAERARLEAERARGEADEAQRSKAELQQQLFKSVSAILETRREARGLIVNLSDVLFEFNRATLTPGAREKLSKLTGVLLAYPGHFRIELEGHTDALGTDEYNLTLSRARAESVASYLLLSGVPAERLGAAAGFGEARPVATNDTAAGRQMNRRVELVIAELDT